MTRLTIDLRRDIATVLAEHSVKEETAWVKQEATALAMIVLAETRPPQVIEAFAVLAENRINAPIADQINANFGGYRVVLSLEDCGVTAHTVDGRRSIEWSATDRDLIDRGQAFAQRSMHLAKARKMSYAEAVSALDRINTVKTLRSVWPQIIPLVDHLLPEQGTGIIPMADLAGLNERLGLPPVKAEG